MSELTATPPRLNGDRPLLPVVPPVTPPPGSPQPSPKDIALAIAELGLKPEHTDRVMAGVLLGKWISPSAKAYAMHALVERIEFWKSAGSHFDAVFMEQADALKKGNKNVPKESISEYLEHRMQADKLVMALCDALVAISGDASQKEPRKGVKAASTPSTQNPYSKQS